MPNELFDLVIEEESTVDRAANKLSKVVLTKSEDPPEAKKMGRDTMAPDERVGMVRRMATFLGVSKMLGLEKQDPKGEAGSKTGGTARNLIRSLQDKGMSFEDISQALAAMGSNASRSSGVLSAILSGEIKNPPDTLLGFLRRVKPPKDEDKEAGVSKDQGTEEGTGDQGEVIKIEDLAKKLAKMEVENKDLRESIAKAGKVDVFRRGLPPALQARFDAMDDDDKKKFMDERDDKEKGEAKKSEDVSKALLDSVSKENTELRESVTKLQEVNKRRAIRDEVADLETITKLDGEGGLVDVISKLRAVDSDAANAMIETFRAVSKQAETGQVFAILGKGGEGDSNPERKIEKAAEEIRKGDPKLTYEQAYSKALEDNPGLYTPLGS